MRFASRPLALLRHVVVLAAIGLAACGGARVTTGAEDRLRVEGRHLFTAAGCAACHTLGAAHATGSPGPNFDTSEKLDHRQIREQLNLGEGGMPSYRDRLTSAQESALTEFLFTATHPGGTRATRAPKTPSHVSP